MTARALVAATLALGLVGCSTAARSPAPTTEDTTPRVTPPRATGVQTGKASWYGRPHHGRKTASGEIYDMAELTAAHRTLPLGTRVRVTNVANGRTVIVRVNDRGPFTDGRILDLSHAAARELDALGAGVVTVRIEVLEDAAVESAPKPASR